MPGANGIVRLRAWEPGDTEVLPTLADNRRIWRNMTDRFPHPYGRREAVAWIGIANADPANARHFAVLVGDEVVGGVGFERLGDLSTRTAEIGYWVGEPHWGRGYATAALKAASAIAFDAYDFARLQASVLGWNDASCRVLEKSGYTREARLRDHGFKDGTICDVVLYAKLRASSA